MGATGTDRSKESYEILEKGQMESHSTTYVRICFLRGVRFRREKVLSPNGF